MNKNDNLDNNKINQEEFEKRRMLGEKIYKYCLIGITLICILVLVFFREENLEKSTFYRYMIFFYCFNGILCSGTIIREYTSGKYIKGKLLAKVIISAITLVLGSVFLWIFRLDTVGLIVFLVGLGVAIYVFCPTLPEKNNQ